MSHDIFICYSSRDKPVADAVCAVLEAEGVRCWIAPRDILPGADWGESIIDSINAASAMVLIFSSNANQAQSQIKREVERAVNKGIPVIPFRIENVMPTKSLEYFLSTPHWLDAFTPPLDEHVRQLADSIKRLLGQQVTMRPLLFSAPPTIPPLPHTPKPIKIDFADIRFGGKPIQEWAREPKHAAILAGCAVILAGLLWYIYRPTATPEDQQAWNMAAMTDTIPAYELYRREQPSGYFRGQATDRIDELKAAADKAFAKAKQINTIQAYANFIQTYGRQGIDVSEAQDAYTRANTQEREASNAYRRAISSRSRQSYQMFLAAYGSSTYAADVRQRLASCHNEVRNNGTTQSSELQESATVTAADPNTACSEARSNATSRAEQECSAAQGHSGSVRILNQRMGNAPASPDVGRVAGQVIGNSLMGNRGYSYNEPTQFQCMTQIAISCSRTSNSARAVEICQ